MIKDESAEWSVQNGVDIFATEFIQEFIILTF